MKRVICDQCRKEEEPDHYGLAPKGWFTVDVRGDLRASRDLCSKACLVAAFGGVLAVSDLERTIEEAERPVQVSL